MAFLCTKATLNVSQCLGGASWEFLIERTRTLHNHEYCLFGSSYGVYITSLREKPDTDIVLEALNKDIKTLTPTSVLLNEPETYARWCIMGGHNHLHAY